MEEKFYEQLKYDDDINIEQKIRMLRTITIFFKKVLIKDKNVFAIDYLNINAISIENLKIFH